MKENNLSDSLINELIINYYPRLGTKIIFKFHLSFSKKYIRYRAHKLGIKKNLNRYTKFEERVACKCYLENKSVIRANKILVRVGIKPRTYNSMHAKMSNYKYLDTGRGSYNYSNLSRIVYIEMTGNTYPYEKPKRKTKGGEF